MTLSLLGLSFWQQRKWIEHISRSCSILANYQDCGKKRKQSVGPRCARVRSRRAREGQQEGLIESMWAETWRRWQSISCRENRAEIKVQSHSACSRDGREAGVQMAEWASKQGEGHRAGERQDVSGAVVCRKGSAGFCSAWGGKPLESFKQMSGMFWS